MQPDKQDPTWSEDVNNVVDDDDDDDAGVGLYGSSDTLH